MYSLCVAFPSVLLRLLAQLGLLAAGLRLVRVDRVGGLLVTAAAGLAVVGEVALPLLGWGGFLVMVNQPGSSPLPNQGPGFVTMMVAYFVIENLGPMGTALAVTSAAVALWRLAGRVPRDRWDQAVERAEGPAGG